MAKSFEFDTFVELSVEAIHALELREMEEEEKYLDCLRTQREKIEGFKLEAQNKDARASELSAEIEKIRSLNRGLEESLQNALDKIKAQETATLDVKHSKKTLQSEYEATMCELQELSIKEREGKSREINQLKQDKEQETEKMNRKEKELNSVITDLSRELEKTRNHLTQNYKEELTRDRLKMGQELKGVSKELAQTKSSLREAQTTVKTLKAQLRELESLTTQQVNSLQVESENESLKRGEEIANLNQELRKALDVVSRQESAFIETRERTQEDALLIKSLKDKLAAKEGEIEELLKKQRSFKSGYEKSKTCISTLERQNSKLQDEKCELSREMREISDRQHQESLQHKQRTQLKFELLLKRSEEANKLKELIDSLPPN